MGHIVGGGTVAVPQVRVEAIKNLRKPVTKKDMRAFLGTTDQDCTYNNQLDDRHD